MESELVKEIFENQSKESLDILKESTLPLIMWGCGDVARNLMKVLSSNNIYLDGIAVDVDLKMNELGNVEIHDFEYYCNKYERFNIIIGHSHYELEDQIRLKYDNIQEVFALSSAVNIVPIDLKYVRENIEEINKAYSILEDEESKKYFNQYINARINNDYRLIQFATYYEKFNNEIFDIDDENYLDLGAYTGDTIYKYLEATKSKYKNIYAIEPSKESYDILCNNFNTYPNIHFYNIGTWNEKTKLYFEGEKAATYISRNKNGAEISVDRLDRIISDKEISFIKINFRFGVIETLEGGEEILKKYKPKLAINVSLDKELFFKVPLILKKINPEYKIFVRFEARQLSRFTLYAK